MKACIPSKSLNAILFGLICILLKFVTVSYAEEFKDPPFILPKQSELNKLRSALITTNRGKIKVELYPEDAPWHVANFKYLADKKFYQGLKFHLYQPDYIIQGGDPLGTGKGGPGYSLPAEFSKHHHAAGTLGMARLENAFNPERRSHGSQFHILMRDSTRMDSEFTIFGKVKEGMKVVKKLRLGDTIQDVVVFVTPEVKK